MEGKTKQYIMHYFVLFLQTMKVDSTPSTQTSPLSNNYNLSLSQSNIFSETEHKYFSGEKNYIYSHYLSPQL